MNAAHGVLVDLCRHPVDKKTGEISMRTPYKFRRVFCQPAGRLAYAVNRHRQPLNESILSSSLQRHTDAQLPHHGGTSADERRALRHFRSWSKSQLICSGDWMMVTHTRSRIGDIEQLSYPWYDFVEIGYTKHRVHTYSRTSVQNVILGVHEHTVEAKSRMSKSSHSEQKCLPGHAG